MLRYLLPRNLRVGARPGVLASDTEVPVKRPLRIWRVTFDADTSEESAYDRFDACPEDYPPGRVTWLHFQGDAPAAVLRHLRQSLHLHPLAMEDVQNLGQRPKVEAFEDYLFVVMILPVRTEAGLAFEQVSLFVGDGHILSFHAGTTDIFAPVRKRIHAGKGRIRRGGSGYLLYALADVVVDYGFPVLEAYADDLEALEDEIFTEPRRNPVTAIHAIKRDLIALRKVLWHQNAMLVELIRADHPLLDDANIPYFRDAEDHARRINDLLDSYRDTCSSLLDTHLSLSSARLNDIIKVLTLIATIFMPLSFVAGVYGMNFDTDSPWNMPELGFRYAYPIVIGAMLVLALGMLALFRRRRWI